MKKIISVFLVLFYASITCFADKTMDEIEQLFHNNQLQDAKPLLLAEIQKGKKEERLFEYLAYVYQYEEDYQKAIATLNKGIELSELHSPGDGASRCFLYLNLANIYRQMKEYNKADEYYTKTIQSNYGYAKGYLNRANNRTDIFKQNGYKDAGLTLPGIIDDYERYLRFEPESPQKEKILTLIDMFKDFIYKEAEDKLRAEEAARLAEEERLRKEEEARRLEEERQRKLLEAILNSLENASDDTKNLSAGNEDIITVDDEGDDDELDD